MKLIGEREVPNKDEEEQLLSCLIPECHSSSA